MRRTDSRQIGGRSIQLPMVDVHTVGAGGGSIGWRDRGGALRVGPRSAGAEPGPACYGRGGDRADRHRRQPAARPPRRRLDAGRRRRARRRRGPRRRRRARRTRSASASWRPPRGSSGSPTRRWCGRCAWSRSSAASTRAASPCSPSAAPGRCTRRRSPPSSASSASSARAPAASSRRSASAPRTAAATPTRTVMLSGADLSAERIAAEVDELIAGLDGELDGAEPEVVYEMRYAGQAFELPVPGTHAPDPADLPSASSRPTRSATATATPTARSSSSTSAWRWSRPGRGRGRPPRRRAASRRAPRRSASTASGSRRRSCAASPPAGLERRGPGRLRAARGDLRPPAGLARRGRRRRHDPRGGR